MKIVQSLVFRIRVFHFGSLHFVSCDALQPCGFLLTHPCAIRAGFPSKKPGPRSWFRMGAARNGAQMVIVETKSIDFISENREKR